MKSFTRDLNNVSNCARICSDTNAWKWVYIVIKEQLLSIRNVMWKRLQLNSIGLNITSNISLQNLPRPNSHSFHPCLYSSVHQNVIKKVIWISSIITPVFSVTWFFRNHSNILICCSRNISYYYQCWKQLCCCCFFFFFLNCDTSLQKYNVLRTVCFYGNICKYSIWSFCKYMLFLNVLWTCWEK